MLCVVAQRDMSALQFPLPDALYGFETQQACEKYMKALLTILGVDYPYTHNLEKLQELLELEGEVLPTPAYEYRRLTPFAAQLRYTYGEPLSEADREAMVETARILGAYVVERILARERDGTAAKPDL